MYRLFLLCLIFGLTPSVNAQLPYLQNDQDWLLGPIDKKSALKLLPNGFSLENGLIKRRFVNSPNLATVELTQLSTGESLLRGIKPEARVMLDKKWYDVGGLVGQQEYGYLQDKWLDTLHNNPAAFQYESYQLQDIHSAIKWDPSEPQFTQRTPYPPTGKHLILNYRAINNIKVQVHYEIYDNLPLMSKWLVIHNQSEANVRLNTFISEILAVVEAETSVEAMDNFRLPNIHIESDYAFHAMSAKHANQTAYWIPDPQYHTQVNYPKMTPNLLECRPPLGPEIDIAPGDSLETFHTYQLFYDSHDKERKGLSLRKMYRRIAPWATENPIFMHLTSTDPEVVKTAIDQCEATGYEMVILSFGSGLNMEDLSQENLDKFKGLADYAHSRGIKLGGYSLLSSRSISPEHDVINPETGVPGGVIHNNAPCLGSEWGFEYLEKLKEFFEYTGFDLLEHDGSYPGHICASTTHPGHRDVHDSQWTQWRQITDFYRWLRARGVYMNIPDWYFLAGSNKVALGYREVNWSLPRERQIILGRQNIYDGTYYKTPSMGWTFVPLVEYHGGGAAATLEPLSEHLADYQAHMAQNYLMGVQACYRGPRLYDSPETLQAVKSQIDLYKKYRNILNADIIHIRRADGRDLDAMMHADPDGVHKGFLVVFNPTEETINKEMKIPLYYTGLTERANFSELGEKEITLPLARDYSVRLQVSVPARSYKWWVIK
ncbi:MAG: alpha-galactosidase [Bacteroidota bacterium]